MSSVSAPTQGAVQHEMEKLIYKQLGQLEKLSNAAKVRPNRSTAEQSGPTRVVPPADEEGSTDD